MPGFVSRGHVQRSLGPKRLQLRVAKIPSAAIGELAILSGLALEGMNVSYTSSSERLPSPHRPICGPPATPGPNPQSLVNKS